MVNGQLMVEFKYEQENAITQHQHLVVKIVLAPQETK